VETQFPAANVALISRIFRYFIEPHFTVVRSYSFVSRRFMSGDLLSALKIASIFKR